MKQYINPTRSKTFRSKSSSIQDLIQTSIYILDAFGVPINRSERMLEKTALVFLACGDVKKMSDFNNVKDLNSGYSVSTKKIIEFVNNWMNENISPGSYDYIKRDALDFLMPSGVVLQSSPDAATNDSTRGYSLNPFYANLLKSFGTPDWNQTVKEALQDIEPLSQKLKRERDLARIRVTLPSGGQLKFSQGEHNNLQKAIIEEFLPRYGYGAEVLYVGDTADKYLHLEKERLESLNFFELAHAELPDIVAYSKAKNWIYLIEAIHSSGSIDELRLIQLKKLTNECSADIVYVSAFLNRLKFRQFITEIAWETEVWIADNPDHLIHFNGDKFLGPYNN